MKKIVFALLILAGALQVKAQQRFTLPGTIFPYQSYTIKPDTGWKKYLSKPNADQLPRIWPYASGNTTASVVYDHMPVVKLNNNDHKMPIVQTDRTGYTMPVAGMNLSGVYTMKKPGNEKVLVP